MKTPEDDEYENLRYVEPEEIDSELLFPLNPTAIFPPGSLFPMDNEE